MSKEKKEDNVSETTNFQISSVGNNPIPIIVTDCEQPWNQIIDIINENRLGVGGNMLIINLETAVDSLDLRETMKILDVNDIKKLSNDTIQLGEIGDYIATEVPIDNCIYTNFHIIQMNIHCIKDGFSPKYIERSVEMALSNYNNQVNIAAKNDDIHCEEDLLESFALVLINTKHHISEVPTNAMRKIAIETQILIPNATIMVAFTKDDSPLIIDDEEPKKKKKKNKKKKK